MEVALPTISFLKLMKSLSETLEQEVSKTHYYRMFIHQAQNMLYPLSQDRKTTKRKFKVLESNERIQVNTKIGIPHTYSTRTNSFNDKKLLSAMKNRKTSQVIAKLLQQDSKRKMWQNFSKLAQQLHKDLHNSTYKVEKKNPVSVRINTYDDKYEFTTKKCYLPNYDTIQFAPHHLEYQDPTPAKTQGCFRFRILNYFGQLYYDFQKPSMDINVLQLINKLNKYFDIAQIFRQKIEIEKKITKQNKEVYEKFKDKYISRLVADAI